MSRIWFKGTNIYRQPGQSLKRATTYTQECFLANILLKEQATDVNSYSKGSSLLQQKLNYSDLI